VYDKATLFFTAWKNIAQKGLNEKLAPIFVGDNDGVADDLDKCPGTPEGV
jgi:hypothetical protein